MYEELFDPGAVAVHVAALDGPDLDVFLEELADAHPEAAICRLAGTESRTQPGFFNEARRALAIPYERISWDVLNEALHDLTWMPAESYVLVVEDAQVLLDQAHPSALDILGSIVTSSGHSLLLQAPPESVDALTSRLDAAGVPFEVL